MMAPGTSTGWSVHRPSKGPIAWEWRAFGPRGTAHGTEKTREEAVATAKRAVTQLNQPRSTEA